MYQKQVWSSDEMVLTGENRSTQRKTYSSVTLTTTNQKWPGLGLNLDLHSDRMATITWPMAWTQKIFQRNTNTNLLE